MAAKAFTILTLALAATASPFSRHDGSLIEAVVDAPVPQFVRRQEEGEVEAPAPKPKSTSSKGKSTSKGKTTTPKPKAQDPPAEEAPAEEPAPKPAKSSSSKGSSAKGSSSSAKGTSSSSSGGASSGLSGLFGGSSSGGSSSSSSSSSSGGGSALGGLTSMIPFGSSLGSMGMMSSSDMKKGYTCKEYALLFARGTGEPGNMGFVVGPPLGTALRAKYGNKILIQGMDYITDFTGGGAREMTKYVKDMIGKCPDTKIALAGYSQGAMQVHQSLGQLGADGSKIAAAVTFGDPYSTSGWGNGGMVGTVMGIGGNSGFNPDNGMIICSTGDFVCGTVPNVGGAYKGAKPVTGGGGGVGHISYSGDGSIQKATKFILEKFGS